MTTKMFYFGPWDSPGHYLHEETGYYTRNYETTVPWTNGEMDGDLQPHVCSAAHRRHCSGTCGKQGDALLHHKNGWTALAMWDSSVDTRGGCVSVYLAEGTYTFEEMMELAKTRFAKRWNRMKFAVTLKKEQHV